MQTLNLCLHLDLRRMASLAGWHRICSSCVPMGNQQGATLDAGDIFAMGRSFASELKLP